MHSITIRHNFEAGHRLPHLPGKCQSLHGHSFWAEVEIQGQCTDDDGILVEYAEAKRYLRKWVDDNWDHGLILGEEDPLVAILMPHGKVYVLHGLWPTVETLALALGSTMEGWCHDRNRDPIGRQTKPTIHVRRCTITETSVNAATWIPA